MREYKTVDTGTIEGVREAELLHLRGWVTYRVGLYLVYMYREMRRVKG